MYTTSTSEYRPSNPLVTCIMPTYNRRAFVPQAIAYFLRQDYPNNELLILDNSADPMSDFIPQYSSIHTSDGI